MEEPVAPERVTAEGAVLDDVHRLDGNAWEQVAACPCFVCGRLVKPPQRCVRCLRACYCSKEHADLDWDRGHAQECEAHGQREDAWAALSLKIRDSATSGITQAELNQYTREAPARIQAMARDFTRFGEAAEADKTTREDTKATARADCRMMAAVGQALAEGGPMPKRGLYAGQTVDETFPQALDLLLPHEMLRQAMNLRIAVTRADSADMALMQAVMEGVAEDAPPGMAPDDPLALLALWQAIDAILHATAVANALVPAEETRSGPTVTPMDGLFDWLTKPPRPARVVERNIYKMMRRAAYVETFDNMQPSSILGYLGKVVDGVLDVLPDRVGSSVLRVLGYRHMMVMWKMFFIKYVYMWNDATMAKIRPNTHSNIPAQVGGYYRTWSTLEPGEDPTAYVNAQEQEMAKDRHGRRIASDIYNEMHSGVRILVETMREVTGQLGTIMLVESTLRSDTGRSFFGLPQMSVLRTDMTLHAEYKRQTEAIAAADYEYRTTTYFWQTTKDAKLDEIGKLGAAFQKWKTLHPNPAAYLAPDDQKRLSEALVLSDQYLLGRPINVTALDANLDEQTRDALNKILDDTQGNFGVAHLPRGGMVRYALFLGAQLFLRWNEVFVYAYARELVRPATGAEPDFFDAMGMYVRITAWNRLTFFVLSHWTSVPWSRTTITPTSYREMFSQFYYEYWRRDAAVVMDDEPRAIHAMPAHMDEEVNVQHQLQRARSYLYSAAGLIPTLLRIQGVRVVIVGSTSIIWLVLTSGRLLYVPSAEWWNDLVANVYAITGLQPNPVDPRRMPTLEELVAQGGTSIARQNLVERTARQTGVPVVLVGVLSIVAVAAIKDLGVEGLRGIGRWVRARFQGEPAAAVPVADAAPVAPAVLAARSQARRTRLLINFVVVSGFYLVLLFGLNESPLTLF